MKHLKYFMCPTTARDYKYCGSSDGFPVNSKVFAPRQNETVTTIKIDDSFRFNMNSKAMCNYQIRYPRGANEGDEIEIKIIEQVNADVFITIGE